MPRRRLRWLAIALAASALILSACVGSAPDAGTGASEPAGGLPAASAALSPATAPTPAESNELITAAGWECLPLPGARVAGGKLILAAGAAGLTTLNDYRLRLETREDVAISITVEADTAPGIAGLQFWNSLPPPGEGTRWFTTAAKLVLGLAGGRVRISVWDGTGATPAYQYDGRDGGQSGPLVLGAQREGDALVFRVAGAEVARTKVLGPLTGGPLWFGPSVVANKTLTVHRFVVTDGAHPRGAEIVRAVAPAAPAGAAPSLRTAAAARDRLIGAYVNQRPFRWNQQLRDVAAREFGLLSAADGFNWPMLRPARDLYQFCPADDLVAFAEANNMRVHAGQLTWSQNPDWLTKGGFSRDELIAILREHIQTVVGRYRGRIHTWNVVNEVFEYNNFGRLNRAEDRLWMRVIGPEYVDMAFRWAHEADPQAVLLFNDVDAEGTLCAARCGAGVAAGSRNLKSDALYEFVKGMLARGVPIHGVGMQAHWGARLAFPTVDPASVAPNMKRLADLGLEVWITEMDLPIVKPVTPDKLAAQTQTYRQVLEICLAATNCKALIIFGVYDGGYALPPFLAREGVIAQGEWTAPLLFDESFRPKSAYEALAEVLRKR
jgi:endo-1,4-beta-xylanase